MKVVGISGSPRKEGNTGILVRKALEGAEGKGADTTYISLAGKDIRGCIACPDCGKGDRCVIDDDMQEIYPLLVEADAIVLGTPIYFGTFASQTKAFIDRCYFLHKSGKRLGDKVGGVIAVGGRAGHELTVLSMMDFMTIVGMVLPGGAFVQGYSREPGAAATEEKALEGAKGLGERLVDLHLRLRGREAREEMP